MEQISLIDQLQYEDINRTFELSIICAIKTIILLTSLMLFSFSVSFTLFVCVYYVYTIPLHGNKSRLIEWTHSQILMNMKICFNSWRQSHVLNATVFIVFANIEYIYSLHAWNAYVLHYLSLICSLVWRQWYMMIKSS